MRERDDLKGQLIDNGLDPDNNVMDQFVQVEKVEFSTNDDKEQTRIKHAWVSGAGAASARASADQSASGAVLLPTRWRRVVEEVEGRRPTPERWPVWATRQRVGCHEILD